MKRLVVRFKDDSEGYVNIQVEEFHEDGDFIKAYNDRNELVGMFSINNIKAIWQSEK